MSEPGAPTADGRHPGHKSPEATVDLGPQPPEHSTTMTEGSSAGPEAFETFGRWLMDWVSEPPMPEELDPAVILGVSGDLSRLVEIVREAEMFCVLRQRELNRRTQAERQRRTDGASAWERTVRLIALSGEAAWWDGRISWLQNVRIYLANELKRYETASTPTR
jgi:hypothetical protein